MKADELRAALEAIRAETHALNGSMARINAIAVKALRAHALTQEEQRND